MLCSSNTYSGYISYTIPSNIDAKGNAFATAAVFMLILYQFKPPQSISDAEPASEYSSILLSVCALHKYLCLHVDPRYRYYLHRLCCS